MKLLLLGLTIAMATPAVANDDLDSIFALNQSQFRLLAEDLGAALSYKPLTPAEPLGLVLGLDMGIEVTATQIENKAELDIATSGDAPSTLIVPKLHVHKGLPFGFDVGALYSQVPDTNITLWGAELRYAIVDGSTVMPAIGLRASFTTLEGVDQLDLETRSLDISVSKGFAIFTPYIGIGTVWITATPQNIPTLTEEDFKETKVFGGLNVNLAILNLALEADTTGEALSYGAKVGLRF